MPFQALTNVRQFLRAAHTVFSWILLLFFGGFAIVSSIHSTRFEWSTGPYHPSLLNHTMPEEDFANLWSAGHLVRLGRVDWVYSSHLFQAWKQDVFGSSLRVQDWIYPPTVLLLGVPLSFLPLAQAFLFWDLGTLILAVLLLRWARLPWVILIVGLLGPATWRSLILGQYGTITGALVIAGLLMARRAPVRAGMMLGFATLKPQQGIIAPVAWLATQNPRAIIAAALTFSALAIAVILFFGPSSWVLFFTRSSDMGKAILDMAPPQDNINTGVSMFWMCRTLGSSVHFANVAQLLFALLATALTYFAWRKSNVDDMARIAFTACTSLMITPYGYTCDMVAFSIAVAIITSKNCWRLRIVDVFLWLWPFYCTVATVITGVLFTPLVVVTAAAIAWRQMQIVESERGIVSRQQNKV
jgi:hypothetical protein